MRSNVSPFVFAFAIALVIAVVLAVGSRFYGTVHASDNMSETAKATYPQVRDTQRHIEMRHMRAGAPVGPER